MLCMLEGKITLSVKKKLFAKIAIMFYKNVESNFLGGSNTSKQISTNKRATMMASRKTMEISHFLYIF